MDSLAVNGLTDEQADAWHRDGFLILDRFIDEPTVAALRAAYADILSRNVAAAGDRMLGEITRQIMMPSAAHPVFNENLALRHGMRIARQLFSSHNVERVFDMLIYKPPGHPHETPWHQDMAYAAQPYAEPGTPIPLKSIQFWVPLDDVDVENGCMQFIPGYHRQPLLAHRVVSGNPDDESRLLALHDPAAQVDLTRVVVAEIPAGAATIHAHGTPHYTGPNRSTNRRRRSYIFNIAAQCS